MTTSRTARDWYEKGKAEGAREAVERIRAELIAQGHSEKGEFGPVKVGWGDLESHLAEILDAIAPERESSLGRDAEGHLVLTLGPGAESPSRKEGWEQYDGMSPLEQREADGDR